MNRSRTAIFTLLIMVFAFPGAAQSADPIEELKACTKLTDRDKRLDCFDSLGERVLREESVVKKPTREEVSPSGTATAATQTGEQPLPDDLGVIKSADEQKAKAVEYSGRVRSCKKGHYGDWYFFFENGQVWKDVGDQRLQFKECKFKVTVSKDYFGYKMNIASLDKTIPIRRHQ